MNSEAQRARNARKRAKLRAKKRGCEPVSLEVAAQWYIAPGYFTEKSVDYWHLAKYTRMRSGWYTQKFVWSGPDSCDVFRRMVALLIPSPVAVDRPKTDVGITYMVTYDTREVLTWHVHVPAGGSVLGSVEAVDLGALSLRLSERMTRLLSSKGPTTLLSRLSTLLQTWL